MTRPRDLTSLKIDVCPVCRSDKIRTVNRDIESRRGGIAFIAQSVQVEECPVCGERLFGPESLDKIAAQQSRAAKDGKRRKTS